MLNIETFDPQTRLLQTDVKELLQKQVTLKKEIAMVSTVSTGEFIVIHIGAGTNDDLGPTYHYFMGESGPQLSNVGEPLSLFEDINSSHNRFTDTAHDFVAYGSF